MARGPTRALPRPDHATWLVEALRPAPAAVTKEGGGADRGEERGTGRQGRRKGKEGLETVWLVLPYSEAPAKHLHYFQKGFR